MPSSEERDAAYAAVTHLNGVWSHLDAVRQLFPAHENALHNVMQIVNSIIQEIEEEATNDASGLRGADK
jgi:hypothetical protein